MTLTGSTMRTRLAKPSQSGSKRRARPGESKAFVLTAAAHKGPECLTWPFSTNVHGYGKLSSHGAAHVAVCAIVDGPKPSGRHQASHTCGRGHEACVSGAHLLWKTISENHKDKIAHNTHRRGERTPTAKITTAKAKKIRRAKGLQREIAEKFGISRAQVSRIKNKVQWAWL